MAEPSPTATRAHGMALLNLASKHSPGDLDEDGEILLRLNLAAATGEVWVRNESHEAMRLVHILSGDELARAIEHGSAYLAGVDPTATQQWVGDPYAHGGAPSRAAHIVRL
ncbi:MAG: hypothetical protein U0531_01915 [Dehalococcoidia bacterium]